MAVNAESKDVNTDNEVAGATGTATSPGSDGAAPAGTAEGAAPAGGTPPASAEGGEGAASGSVDSGAAPGGPAPKPEAGAPEEDWRDKRIAVLTAKLHEERAKKAPLAAPPDQAAAPVAKPEDVVAMAARMVAEQKFTADCNQAALDGRKAFPDFDKRLGGLKQIVDPNDPAEVAAYNRMLGAILETGEAPRLLYELGGDPDKASKMLGMAAQAPMKLAVELTRMALTKGEAEPSAVAKPIAPVGDRGRTVTLIDPTDVARADNLSTKEWMARREADIEAKRKGGMRIS